MMIKTLLRSGIAVGLAAGLIAGLAVWIVPTAQAASNISVSLSDFSCEPDTFTLSIRGTFDDVDGVGDDGNIDRVGARIYDGAGSLLYDHVWDVAPRVDDGVYAQLSTVGGPTAMLPAEVNPLRVAVYDDTPDNVVGTLEVNTPCVAEQAPLDRFRELSQNIDRYYESTSDPALVVYYPGAGADLVVYLVLDGAGQQMGVFPAAQLDGSQPTGEPALAEFALNDHRVLVYHLGDGRYQLNHWWGSMLVEEVVVVSEEGIVGGVNAAPPVVMAPPAPVPPPVVEPPPLLPPAPMLPAAAPVQAMAQYRLNIRAMPTTTAPTLATVPVGTPLALYGTDADGLWAYAQTADGLTGWVVLPYLSINFGTVDDLPVMP